jgi:hypothetical protein
MQAIWQTPISLPDQEAPPQPTRIQCLWLLLALLPLRREVGFTNPLSNS